jgi:hypothetical protein
MSARTFATLLSLIFLVDYLLEESGKPRWVEKWKWEGKGCQILVHRGALPLLVAEKRVSPLFTRICVWEDVGELEEGLRWGDAKGVLVVSHGILWGGDTWVGESKTNYREIISFVREVSGPPLGILSCRSSPTRKDQSWAVRPYWEDGAWVWAKEGENQANMGLGLHWKAFQRAVK